MEQADAAPAVAPAVAAAAPDAAQAPDVVTAAETTQAASAASVPLQPPLPHTLSATGPRLHVPRQVGLFAEAVGGYVVEHDTNSIAGDVRRMERTHHALALPSSDNYMVLPSTTSMSTVTSLLQDAFQHLSALAPVDTVVSTLEDKYADIWAEIAVAKAAENGARLRRVFAGWKQRAQLLHLVTTRADRAHARRLHRLFIAWRSRVRLLARVAAKFARATSAHVATVFQRLKRFAARSRKVQAKHRRALQTVRRGIFARWRAWAAVRRRLHRHQRRRNLKAARAAFALWRARLPVWRQTKRAVARLARALNRGHLRLQFTTWRQNHGRLCDALQERRRLALRRTFVLECCFKAWKRQLMLHYRIKRKQKAARQAAVANAMAMWKQYWLGRRALRPATWTCDLVGIWLAALFHLPLEIAATCHVTGQELLELGPKLHIDLHQPSSWAATSLERLLPQMPLFFCASHHRMQLLEAISALASPVASQAARDALARHRQSQLAMVTDLTSLRYFWAQDREMLVYVRRLDTLSLDGFLGLSTEALLRFFQPQKESHLTLLRACQEQLRGRPTAPSPLKTPTAPPPLDVAGWLESVHLAQYIPRFLQARIDSREKLAALDHAALRDRLYIHSKLHRDRLMQYITELRHSPETPATFVPLKKTHVPLAASFRLKMALNHVDDTTAPTAKPRTAATAKLQKQIRTLFFTLSRAMEDREWSLEELFTALQSSAGAVTKANFAHLLRDWSCGLSSAHIHAMWEALARADPGAKRGVGYTAFMTFFVDVFEQRYQLLTLAIQTLQDQAHKSEKQREQLGQLLQSAGRTRRILTLAGVDMTRR
ncbi:hypothetical protein ACHHYP_13930 [Achlya hypogyna]|uniref:SAM domain-containing protein n=1 Tax=Achlya hypogyna TaxID=1202772 RepID=A0A1V9YE84_ACHHY|nr:hypothetical protein ACHHYP_13930 [Achlya hypogyna]